MFCSACGSEVAEGLRFCNRCGASLGVAAEAPPRLLTFIIVLSLALATVTIVGLFFMLILGTEMMGRRDSTSQTYIFMALLFLTVLGVDALIVRQISRLLNIYLQTGDTQAKPARGRGTPKPPKLELTTPAAVETAALHSTASETHELPVDTAEQESPTRKL